MPKGNQINLGESVTIDTDEVQLSHMFKDKDGVPSTRIVFKNAVRVVLDGDAKVAFDAWAESLRPVAEAGQRELCKTCGWQNVNSECMYPGQRIVMYPECFEDEDA